MTHQSGHIPEHELLEFIEGALPPNREAVVSAALARDPHLARLVAALKADRRSLIALGDVQAPAELAERLESILERQALLGLSDSGAYPASLPVSQLTPSRAPVTVRLWRSPAARILAAAAGLAIVAGVGIWAVSALRPALQGLGGGQDVALDVPGPVPDVPEVIDPAPAPIEVAAADPGPFEAVPNEPAPLTIDLASLLPSDSVPGAASAAVTEAAAAIQAPPAVSSEVAITPERALALARAGRLAIVVESVDPAAAAARIETIARGSTSPRSASWRRIDGGLRNGQPLSPGSQPLMAPGYETLAALWAPGYISPSEVPTPIRPDGPVVIAGTMPHAPAIGPGIRIPLDLPQWAAQTPLPAAVYSATIEDRDTALASLLASVRSIPGARGATFVETPLPIDATPPADPDAVLWWTGTPSSWTWRIAVPVVVQTTAP